MTYEEIFNKSKEIIMQSDVSDIPGHLAVQINITGESEGAFYVELKNGTLHVEPYEYYDRDCKFIVSAKDFLKLVDGSLNAVFAYTTGKLKVEGNLEKALEFQKIVNAVKAKQKKK
ncbi:MAG: SCP2 sterol-binding domain-containing protein [Oscillospiraceae bacterium]|nr:SCP2 sterol-binding domain-containing protein [Oscillospiraceae bacterium]